SEQAASSSSAERLSFSCGAGPRNTLPACQDSGHGSRGKPSGRRPEVTAEHNLRRQLKRLVGHERKARRTGHWDRPAVRCASEVTGSAKATVLAAAAEPFRGRACPDATE